MASASQAVASEDVALSVRDLTVSLPAGMERAHAVENVSFDLKRGQILCIIGEVRIGQVGHSQCDHGASAQGDTCYLGFDRPEWDQHRSHFAR